VKRISLIDAHSMLGAEYMQQLIYLADDIAKQQLELARPAVGIATSKKQCR
jgi:hypothetical protein